MHDIQVYNVALLRTKILLTSHKLAFYLSCSCNSEYSMKTFGSEAAKPPAKPWLRLPLSARIFPWLTVRPRCSLRAERWRRPALAPRILFGIACWWGCTLRRLALEEGLFEGLFIASFPPIDSNETGPVVIRFFAVSIRADVVAKLLTLSNHPLDCVSGRGAFISMKLSNCIVIYLLNYKVAQHARPRVTCKDTWHQAMKE